MNEIDKVLLLELARDAIETKFSDSEPDLSSSSHINGKRTVFVSLSKHRNLRGEAGDLKADKPLYKAIVEKARKTAFEDSRFTPLRKEELGSCKIEISVLNELQLLKGDPDDYPDQIDTGKEGLYMECPGKALLLPSVAKEKGYTSLQFLNALAQAAGMSFKSWKDPDSRIYKFRAETFSE